MLLTPSRRVVQGWQKTIGDRGKKRLKTRELLEHFDVKRRGTKVIRQITEFLKSQEPPIFVDGLQDTDRGLDARVTLSRRPIKRAGIIWRGATGKERRGLEKRLKDDWGETMLEDPPLSLKIVKPEFRPPGSTDRLDYLCVDTKGNPVAVEIKVVGGERRAVEQLLRYIHQVRRLKQFKDKKVTGVLITGKSDLATQDALAVLDPWKLITWYLYGFDRARNIKPLERFDVRRYANPNA